MRSNRRISENQIALPFRAGERGILALATPFERRIVGAVGVLLTLLVVLYIYLVVASIAHVAARQELAGKISVATVAVAKLETSYLAKTQAITETYARSIGFVPPARQAFVERNAALTLHDAP